MTNDRTIIDLIDKARGEAGFLSVVETVRLIERGNYVLDPFSVLIARNAAIGTGNVFHPGVTIGCADTAALGIGDDNVFLSHSLLVAETGIIRIGSGNQFGEGGFTARANRPESEIFIGNGGRYTGGVTIYGRTFLGSGSQILGRITVDGVVLGTGADHEEPDPDRRGGVLKGHGRARSLKVGMGEVIVGNGDFRQDELRRQTDFHR